MVTLKISSPPADSLRWLTLKSVSLILDEENKQCIALHETGSNAGLF